MTAGPRSLTEPPNDLSSFPSIVLTPSKKLYRIHFTDVDPRWFGGTGDSRFDLSKPNGVCYVAETPLGCFVEIFRDLTLISPDEIAARRISEIRAPQVLRLADLTSPRARGFGCTGEIHTSVDYELTQKWAAALSNHFAGLRYLVRHDPSQRQIGFALFGIAGVAKTWPTPSTKQIAAKLIEQIEQHFQIRVVPKP